MKKIKVQLGALGLDSGNKNLRQLSAFYPGTGTDGSFLILSSYYSGSRVRIRCYIFRTSCSPVSPWEPELVSNAWAAVSNNKQALNHIGSNYAKQKSQPPRRNLPPLYRHHKEDFARYSSPIWDEWFMHEVSMLPWQWLPQLNFESWALNPRSKNLKGLNIPQWLFTVE